jgi:hypothetical protein
VPDELRGRVLSVHVLLFMGTAPLGSLLSGAMAEKIGEPTAALVNAGILLAVTVLVFLLRPSMRRLE